MPCKKKREDKRAKIQRSTVFIFLGLALVFIFFMGPNLGIFSSVSPSSTNLINSFCTSSSDHPDRVCACSEGHPVVVKKVFNIPSFNNINYNLTYTGYSTGAYVRISCGPIEDITLKYDTTFPSYSNTVKNESLIIPSSCVINNTLILSSTYYMTCRVASSENLDVTGVCSENSEKCSGTNHYVCKNDSWINQGQIVNECGYTQSTNTNQTNTTQTNQSTQPPSSTEVLGETFKIPTLYIILGAIALLIIFILIK